MSHLKLSSKEIELFVLSMKFYQEKLNTEHPNLDVYKFVAKHGKKKDEMCQRELSDTLISIPQAPC